MVDGSMPELGSCLLIVPDNPYLVCLLVNLLIGLICKVLICHSLLQLYADSTFPRSEIFDCLISCQEPLTEEEIEELISELLEVESKVK